VKVIASSLRKGNVVEMDGKLYVVLKAENFHPGKGTPTTSVDMRRISDGVKVAERWRTTEMVEKASIDEREYDFLYEDGEGFHFMNPESYEQVTVSADVVGDDKVFRPRPRLISPRSARMACASWCRRISMPGPAW
jgi:elongation factor P